MPTINLLTAELLEKIIGYVLQLDEEAAQKLQALNGKCICIKLTDLQQQFIFEIENNAIQVASQSEKKHHVTMAGTSFAFFNLSLSDTGSDTVFKGEIHFEGEISSAQKFQQFWQSIDIDWEEHIAKYTGDIVAHQCGRFARQAHAYMKNLFITSQQNFSEYIKEEARLTPDPCEIETFYDDLDDLKSDLSRLELRVQALLKCNNSHDR